MCVSLWNRPLVGGHDEQVPTEGDVADAIDGARDVLLEKGPLDIEQGEHQADHVGEVEQAVGHAQAAHEGVAGHLGLDRLVDRDQDEHQRVARPPKRVHSQH